MTPLRSVVYSPTSSPLVFRTSNFTSGIRSLVSSSLLMMTSPPAGLLYRVMVCASPFWIRILCGVSSRTKPSTVLVSRTVTVKPGSRSLMTIRPFASVTYSPLFGPMILPSLPVTRKATPARGVVLFLTYFWMVSD